MTTGQPPVIPPATAATAVVLGGGGVAGIAWLTGLLLGLEDEGVALRDAADLLIGTSVGATVAAQIAGDTALLELYERQTNPTRQVDELAPKPHLLELLGNAMPVLFKLGDPPERTRRIGELALKTTTVPETVRKAVIAARLPTHGWPERNLKIAAVDVATGEAVVFDRNAGVALVDAVAASCAVPGIWPPVTIDGRRYMDGGIRSSDNADFASGHARVIVLSPLGNDGMTIPGGNGLSDQVARLHAAGARVEVIEPDENAKTAIGKNPLSPETRRPAAVAGRAQGHAIAGDIATFVRSA